MNIITKAGIEYIEPEREASESELEHVRTWLQLRRIERNRRDARQAAAALNRVLAEAVALAGVAL